MFHPGEDVANLTYFGLYSLQHRGQESAGIAVSDGHEIRIRKEMGLVSQVFDQETIDNLKGNIAIGHTRYSTTGSARLPNAQPILVEHPTIGPVVIAHNGNLVNATKLRDELIAKGVAFETTSDTEVLGELLVQTRADSLENALAEALPRVEGAYCLVFLTRTRWSPRVTRSASARSASAVSATSTRRAAPATSSPARRAHSTSSVRRSSARSSRARS